jgi:hypothetical protein
MRGYARWSDIRAGHAERAGGEAAVAEGEREILAESDRTVAASDQRSEAATAGVQPVVRRVVGHT